MTHLHDLYGPKVSMTSLHDLHGPRVSMTMTSMVKHGKLYACKHTSMVLVEWTASSNKSLLGIYGLHECVQQVCSKLPTIMVAHICHLYELIWLSCMHYEVCHAWQASHKQVGNVDTRLQRHLSAKMTLCRLYVRTGRKYRYRVGIDLT